MPLSAGGEHTCAILDGVDVKCWGYNGYGQLGYDSTDNKGVGPPGGEHSMSKLGTVFLNYTNATAITTGLHHTCALLDGGHVKCWGRAGSGQLGYDCHGRGEDVLCYKGRAKDKGSAEGEHSMARLGVVNLNATAISITGEHHHDSPNPNPNPITLTLTPTLTLTLTLALTRSAAARPARTSSHRCC